MMNDVAVIGQDLRSEVRQAMGENLFGFEEWSEALDYSVVAERISPQLADQLIEILCSPCPFEENRQVKDTHILFQGVSRVREEELTLMWLQKHYPYFFDSAIWYASQSFANTPLETGWHLAYHSMVLGSFSRTLEEQKKMLPAGYLPTSPMEEVVRRFLTSKCQKKKTIRWPSSGMVRTSGGRVCVNPRWSDENQQLDFCVYAEQIRSNIIGISAVRIIQ